MAEDIANSLAIREQNLADFVEMATESIPVADDDADLPNVGDAKEG